MTNLPRPGEWDLHLAILEKLTPAWALSRDIQTHMYPKYPMVMIVPYDVFPGLTEFCGLDIVRADVAVPMIGVQPS